MSRISGEDKGQVRLWSIGGGRAAGNLRPGGRNHVDCRDEGIG